MQHYHFLTWQETKETITYSSLNSDNTVNIYVERPNTDVFDHISFVLGKNKLTVLNYNGYQKDYVDQLAAKITRLKDIFFDLATEKRSIENNA